MTDKKNNQIETPVTKLTQSDLENRIRMDQLKMALMHLPYLSASNLVGTCMLLYLFWGLVATHILMSWLFVSVFFVVGVTGFYLYLYKRVGITPQNFSNWSYAIILLGFCRAAAWGSISIIFYMPDSLPYNLIIYIFCVVGASMTMLMAATYKPTFFMVTVPILLPITIRFFLETDSIPTSIAVGTILYEGALFYVFKNLHATLYENVSLRFQHSELVNELRAQKEEAEDANLAKSRFLAAASHDLRQPLHAQSLFVEELKHYISDTESAAIFSNLESSMEALHGMFNAMLDISKLDAQVVEPVMSNFPIKPLLDEILVDSKNDAQKKDIQLKAIADDDMVVYSDRNLLGRIIRNLTSNAIKYTDQGTVTITCNTIGNSISIAVEDSGIGIPKTHFKTIFQEYNQLGNPERDRAKGIGLGLAIVSRLCKLLKLNIEVKSELNQGSCFFFSVNKGDITNLNYQPAEMHGLSGPLIESVHVLVIDDEPSNRAAMTSLLEGWGYSVTASGDLEEAMLSLIPYKPPSIIVADYRLPRNTNGIDAIKAIANYYNQNIPALLITGDTGPAPLQHATTSGLLVLHKPVAPAKLRSALLHLLQQGTTVAQ